MADDLDPKIAEERERIDELERRKVEREDSDFREVLKTPGGRRWVYAVLAEGGQFRSSFVPGDPHGTSFNCGKRDIAIFIHERLMRAKPEAFSQMLHEHHSEEKQKADLEAKRKLDAQEA